MQVAPIRIPAPDLLVGGGLLFALLVRSDDKQVRAHQYRDQQSHPALSVPMLGFGAI